MRSTLKDKLSPIDTTNVSDAPDQSQSPQGSEELPRTYIEFTHLRKLDARRRQTRSADLSVSQENVARNRYGNVLAYDSTRVKLEHGVTNDYINASWIDVGGPRRYIAAQGPLPSTAGNFWQMVIETESSAIVMLTNLVEDKRVKCAQYWPEDIGVPFTLPGEVDITIQLTAETVKDHDFELRVFDVQVGDVKRRIPHYLFTKWQDFSIPKGELVAFLDTVNKSLPETTGDNRNSVVVHCSAGIGRTGSYIAIDALRSDVELRDGSNAVYDVVDAMREQRPGMVQSLSQYEFIYDMVY